jgi:hypothetical protein
MGNMYSHQRDIRYSAFKGKLPAFRDPTAPYQGMGYVEMSFNLGNMPAFAIFTCFIYLSFFIPP